MLTTEVFLLQRCLRSIYAGLARLSAGCPPEKGRLHTCYSPVRRSPAEKASFLSAAPRLACVKPAASVHPEPGSNSPLLYFVFRLLFCFVSVLTYFFRIDGKPFRSCFPCMLFVLWQCCHCSLFASRSWPPHLASFPKRDCKITTETRPVQVPVAFFRHFSSIFIAMRC